MVDYKDFNKEEYSMDENPLAPLKVDNELFKDEDYIAQPLIQVKRQEKTKDGEVWKIFENGKVSVLIVGSRFTNKEKDFLRTPDGFIFLINGYKQGWRSINKFKVGLR